MAAPPTDEEGLCGLLTPTNVVLAAGVGLTAMYLLRGSAEDTRKITNSPALYSQYGEGPHYTCARDGCIPIKRSRSGISSMAPSTIVDVFKRAVAKNGERVCWRRETEPGNWELCTWTKHYRNCTKSAKSLMALGLEAHDAVNIIGFNSWQWFTANMGCILAGGIAAGQYGTNSPGQCKFIASHCEAKILFLEGMKQLNKWTVISKECPSITTIVCWGVTDQELEEAKANFSIKLMTFDEFMELGNSVSDEELNARNAKMKPGHCCELIYTSGTTGNPKAVMMSHDNLVWGAKNVLHSSGLPKMNHRIVSYLPLSHVAAQMLDIYSPMALTAVESGVYGETWFARPDALKGSLKTTLVAAKPTIFFGVPRVWEKFKSGILEKAKVKKNAVMQALVDFSKKKCKERNDSLSMNTGPRNSPFGYGIGSTLMGKVKSAIGLDKCQYFVTGAAPISRDTLEYFKNLDIFIDEVYGMSESGGAASLGRIYHREMGSTGPAVEGCEIKLDHVEGRDKKGEGEICFRGRNIMMGYLTNEKKTKESIDDEGFMHSGDVGRFDKHGCLYITGRIKELLITEGGENIAPVPIESYINDFLPGLSNVIMIGDKRKYNSCLVSLKTAVDVETDLPTNKLEGPALDVSPGVTTLEEAMEDATWQEYIQSGIDKYNADPDVCVSRATRIQYFKVLPQDLSRPEGTLGPTLKIKRPVVYEKYADLIESMYTR